MEEQKVATPPLTDEKPLAATGAGAAPAPLQPVSTVQPVGVAPSQPPPANATVTTNGPVPHVTPAGFAPRPSYPVS